MKSLSLLKYWTPKYPEKRKCYHGT